MRRLYFFARRYFYQVLPASWPVCQAAVFVPTLGVSDTLSQGAYTRPKRLPAVTRWIIIG